MADITTAAQAALDGDGVYEVPPGSNTHTGLTIPTGGSLIGAGSSNSILTHTGEGAAFSPQGAGRIYGWTIRGIYSTGSGVGFDMAKVSSSRFDDVVCNSHTTGFNIGGDASGDAVYNTFTHCSAILCDVGWSIYGPSSNENRLIACRAGGAETGIQIAESNHTILMGCALEACDVAVSVSASVVGVSDGNQAVMCRFESNTNDWTIGANVRDTANLWPYGATTGTFVDGGTRTTNMDPRRSGSGLIVRDAAGAYHRLVAAGRSTCRVDAIPA